MEVCLTEVAGLCIIVLNKVKVQENRIYFSGIKLFRCRLKFNDTKKQQFVHLRAEISLELHHENCGHSLVYQEILQTDSVTAS